MMEKPWLLFFLSLRIFYKSVPRPRIEKKGKCCILKWGKSFKRTNAAYGYKKSRLRASRAHWIIASEAGDKSVQTNIFLNMVSIPAL